MRLLVVIALFLSWAQLASAQLASAQVAIGPVTGQPTVLNVNPDGMTNVRLRWRVQLNSAVGGLAKVISGPGTISVGGALGGTLSRPFRHPGGGAFFVTITENIYLDRTTAQRLADRGGASFNRVFSVGAVGGTSIASVQLRPSSGGALSLRNLDMSFDDGSRYRVVEVGAPVSARLVVTSNGRGFFSGRWEVAGPVASSVFRPVGRVSRRLAGARRTVFEAPGLPTDRPGLYRVRFVSDGSNASRIVSPQLTYTVTGKDKLNKKKSLSLLSPAPSSDVSGATRFRWQEVPGAERYKVEFSTKGLAGFSGEIVAAVAVSGTSMRPKPNTIMRLSGQNALFWRVIAFDRAGNPIASSAQRRLR